MKCRAIRHQVIQPGYILCPFWSNVRNLCDFFGQLKICCPLIGLTSYFWIPVRSPESNIIGLSCFNLEIIIAPTSLLQFILHIYVDFHHRNLIKPVFTSCRSCKTIPVISVILSTGDLITANIQFWKIHLFWFYDMINIVSGSHYSTI